MCKSNIYFKKIVFLILIINITIPTTLHVSGNKNNSNICTYQQQLVNDPFNLELLLMLANEYLKSNYIEEAINQYKKIIDRNPQNINALFNLGISYVKNNNKNIAKKYFEKVIEISPTHTKALEKIADILVQQNHLTKAIKIYKKIIEIAPNNKKVYIQLAAIYKKQEKYHEVIYNYNKVLTIDPQDNHLRFKLGNIYIMLGQTKNAIQQFKKIVKKHPNNYSAWHNIGYALKSDGYIHEAIQCYNQSLKIKPDYEASTYGIALAYLYNGDFTKGWKQYAWRLKKEKRNAEKLRKWIKENNLHGKTIYLMPEGGIGDTIHFFRYVQRLQSMGANLIIAVQAPLIPLLSLCPYVQKKLLNAREIYNTKIQYHDKASIMSLPAIFESSEEDIPKNIPYIFPDKELVEIWKKYFSGNKNFKIGLCWEADVKNDVSRAPVARRSIPLLKLARLSQLPQVQFYSLQKSTGVSQIKDLPKQFVVQTFGPDFDDKHGPFMDTAAIMKHLDLIITVDTSIAHLAGALGKPVWVMLPYYTDWRWIVNRKDSPWYSTMKIFKQSKPFDWDGVVENIFEELKNKI